VRRFRLAFLSLVWLALASSLLQAQQRRLSGRVTAEGTGEPLPGSSIAVAGSAAGAVADDQGAFTLLLGGGPAQLTVRRIGYKQRVVQVAADQTEVSVALVRDVLQLETQVVTGAATSISRRNAANDVAQVTAEQITNVPAQSIENALAGKIAGAQIISNTGAPGGGNQIRMRGVTSVFGSADPLYVIDGVIVNNDVIQPGNNAISSARRQTSNSSNQDNGVNRIADFNPNDFELVEVLKGASASAIYGSKASNGVVLLRTKTGQPGKPQFNIVQRFGTFDLSNTFGAKRFTLAEAITHGVSKGFTEQEVRDNFASCNGFCDYEGELFGENPLSYETSITARGGTQGTQFFASALNKYDGGIQKNTGYRKQSLRLNLTQSFGDRLRAQINTNAIRTVTRRGISNNDNANITPYFVLAATPSWFDMRPRDGSYPANPFAVTNSFQNVDRIETPSEVYRLLSGVVAEYTLIANDRHGLTLRADGGIDRFNQQDNIVSPRDLFFESNDGLPGTVTSQSGNVLNANFNLSATHEWFPASQLLSTRTSVGLQREISQRRLTNIVTRDVILGQENVNRGAATEVFADRQEVRGLAFFGGEEVLLLEERLLLSAGLRAERSTTNGDIDKFYIWPKGSVSYRLPRLPAQMDEMKLRVAVGRSGNLPLYIQKYQPALATVYDGQNGLQGGTFNGNPNVEPERQTEIEGGFDASFLTSRGSLSFTLYQKTIDDVILQIATAPSLGYTVDIRNAGSIRNRGVEATLALQPFALMPIETGSLDWLSRTTFARNRGIVTKLPVPAFSVAQDAYGANVAFGAGYGVGRLEEGKSVTQIAGSCGAACVRTAGDAAPDFTMGFFNELSWRGWRMSTLFDWQSGGDLVNVTKNVYDAYGLAPDVPDGGLARIDLNDGQGIAQYIEDASYLKWRELTLSYDLGPSLVSRVFRGSARTARIEFSARDLYTWTDYTGASPEVSNFGSQQISRFIDLAPFPPSRSIFLSLDVGF
jgi:TonB-linked SusC/RagA family outer membrane protein